MEFPNHYPPEDRDPTLRDRFTEPATLSGVLNWAIQGWARLLEQDHFTGEATDAHEKRRRWQRWGDVPDEFIGEHVTVDDSADRLTSREVHRRFRKWCRQEGKDDDTAPQTLTKKLKAAGADYKSSLRIGGEQTRGFTNVRLSEDVPELTGGEGVGTDQERLG